MSRHVAIEVSTLKKTPTSLNHNISEEYSHVEFSSALNPRNLGKAPGSNCKSLQFVFHGGEAVKS